MIRNSRVILVVALLASCFPTHDPATVDRSGTACVDCHLEDYKGTTAVAASDPAVPDHIANAGTYPKTCVDCHNTKSWYGHPDALFPIAKGAHANLGSGDDPSGCGLCHSNSDDNAGDAHGANTQCVSCHPATEIVNGQTLPDGHIKHPDQLFPQTHHARTTPWKCADCHNGEVLSTFDGYTNPPAGFTGQNFCLSCHPTGKLAGGGSTATCAKAACHAHSEAHHQGDGDPVGCLKCHPRGAGGG